MQFSLQQFVILLENVITHFNNNAESFKHFVLVTHDHREKLCCEHEIYSQVWRIFVFLAQSWKLVKKIPPTLFPELTVKMDNNHPPQELYVFISVT